MKKLKLITVGMFAMTALFSCQNEDTDDLSTENSPTETVAEIINSSIPADIIQRLKEMDFDTDQEIKEVENGYVVEGDMIITHEALTDTQQVGPEVDGIEKQFRHIEIVRCSRARNIRVRNNLSGVNAQVRNAINDWNRVNGSFLRFNLVTGGNADININFVSGDSGISTAPFNGRAGATIEIDPGVWRNATRPNEFGRAFRYVIRHELGHCVGFRHSNRNEGGRVRIPGVPAQDNQSIMNQASSLAEIVRLRNRNLSGNDQTALRRVYGGSAQDNICF